MGRYYSGSGYRSYTNYVKIDIHKITPNDNNELVLTNLQSFPQNISEVHVYKVDSDFSTYINRTTIPKGYVIRIDKKLYTFKEEDLTKLSNPNQIIVKANDGSFVTINTDQSQNFSLSNDTSVLSKSIEPQKDLEVFVNSHEKTFVIVAVATALIGTIFILQIVAEVCIAVLKYINKKKLNDIASNLEQIVNREVTKGTANLNKTQKQDIENIINLISDAAISIDRYYCCHHGIIDEMSSRMDSNQLTHKALSQLNTFCKTNGIQQNTSNDSNLEKALRKNSSLEAKIEELKILTDAVVLYCQTAKQKIDISKLAENNDNSKHNLETRADDEGNKNNILQQNKSGGKGRNT